MRNTLKNISIFVSYFLYEAIFLVLLELSLNIDYFNLNQKEKIITLFCMNLIYILMLLIVYKKELKNEANDFKTNGKKYLNKYLKYYLLGVILMYISNLILIKITNLNLSGNEETIRKLIDKYPIYMFFSSVIYSPFVEEIIFRKSIMKIIKNKYAFIIISGLIFGSMHISDFTDINQILMGIPYIIMGIDFSYIFYKTKNIFTTMTFHTLHNLILIIVQLL